MNDAQCLVTRADYQRYWQGDDVEQEVQAPPAWDGPERRTNQRQRRWEDVGGRRLMDKKRC